MNKYEIAIGENTKIIVRNNLKFPDFVREVFKDDSFHTKNKDGLTMSFGVRRITGIRRMSDD